MKKYLGKTCRLLTMLGMIASFFLVEIIVGYITNSIALVADSFHMLSNAVALILGFASVWISQRRTLKNTFGWVRAEVLGALVNCVFLVALCFSIIVEALKRLIEPVEIHNPKLMLIVGGASLLVNFIGIGLFHKHGRIHCGGGRGHGRSHGDKSNHSNHCHSNGTNSKSPEEIQIHIGNVERDKLVKHSSPATEEHTTVFADSHSENVSKEVIQIESNRMSASSQFNMRVVFLHVLGDALGSVIVVVTALLIWFIDEKWVLYMDPAMSITMVCVILSKTIPLLKENSFILLQTVPTHIKVSDIKRKIEQIKGVQAVHELHVWQLAGNKLIASAHVQFYTQEYMLILGKIKTLFHNEGIHSITIQPEYSEKADMFSSQDCILACETDKICKTDACCPLPDKSSPTTAAEEQVESPTCEEVIEYG